MLFCGTAGWTRPDWEKVVFPPREVRRFHPLEFLAQRLDVVEISQSFDRPLRPELVRLWISKAELNPRFLFTAVLGRCFTHDRVVDPASVKAFKEGLWPLLRAKKLGAVLMRLPWSFRFTKENREFIIDLRRTFHEFPLAAELRHQSWTLDEALGTLMDYRIGFCNVDQPQGTGALVPNSFVTSHLGYVRLLGRGGDDWANEETAADYLYSPQELGAWQSRIERVAKHTTSTFVIAANVVAGKSMVNAMQLRSLFGEHTTFPRRRSGLAETRQRGTAAMQLPLGA